MRISGVDDVEMKRGRRSPARGALEGETTKRNETSTNERRKQTLCCQWSFFPIAFDSESISQHSWNRFSVHFKFRVFAIRSIFVMHSLV